MHRQTVVPDFLRPIRENNRDEYILVEFHRVLKNTNFSLLHNIMNRATKDPEFMELFPTLKAYAQMTRDGRYNATVLYNYPYELISNLAADQFSVEMCQSFAQTFATPYNFEKAHITRIEIVLKHLLEQNFVKKLYVFAPEFDEEMKSYLAHTFGHRCEESRVVALEGNLHECLLAKPEITTVFMSNTSDFITFHEIYPEKVRQKFFIIMEGYDNMSVDPQTNALTLAEMKLFEELDKKRICTVGYTYPHCITEDETTKGDNIS